MAFDPDAYLAQSGGFDPDAYLAEKDNEASLGGFAKNVVTDVKRNLKGAADLAGQVAGHGMQSFAEMSAGTPITKTPIYEDAKSFIKSVPGGLLKESERIGMADFGKGLVGSPHENPVKKFGQAFYDQPVTTAMDVLPALGSAGKALGLGRAAETAGLASEAGSLVDDVARVAPEAASNPGLRVATKLRGKTYIGEPGDLHVDLIRRMAEQEGIPESAMYDTINKIGDQGFSQAGKFLTRQEASDLSGGVKGEAASLLNAGKMEGSPLRSGAPEAPSPFDMGDEAAQILKEKPAPQPPPPTEPPPVDPLGEVKNFIDTKYQQAAKTPGAIHNFGKALEQKGRGMRFKEIGATPAQVRGLKDRFGEDAVNDLADLAEEKGITKGFFNFQTGDAIKNLNAKAGKQIGAIRELAKSRGAVHNMDNLINQIRAELDPVYMKGTGSAQKGTYMKALQDIKNSAPDAESLANTITDKLSYIRKNKMSLPLGATKDVMTAASRLNNEMIGKFLNPSERQLYQDSLRDFSAAKTFDKMYGFTYGRDMAGRSGPASPINFIKDVGGRKIMEKVFSKVGRKMQSNPELYGSPTSLTSDVLDAINDSLDEIIEQMGSGDVKQ